MTKPLIWIVGDTGLLGSHVRSALHGHFPYARLWQSAPAHFSWSDSTRLMEELRHAAATFAAAVLNEGEAWAVLWCAGKGAMNSSASELEPERYAWSQLLDLLGHHLTGPHSDLPGFIFLASSAGGIYGGNLGTLLTEHSPPHPVSEYGAHKLRLEEALRNWADGSSNLSYLVGRISTLYGPGQDLRKPQGIISHLSRCLIYRYPVSIYVPLDTRRDYLFVDDCARQIVASLRRMVSERPRAVLKIFANEQSTSLAQILGVFFRMAKHRSLIVSRQAQRAESGSVKFRSGIWSDVGGLYRTDLTTGIHLLHEHQLSLFQRGLLPPPS